MLLSKLAADKKKKPKHTRSRFGCKECKRLKMKCDELKPSCSSCLKKGKICDYSMTLTWGGRPYKTPKTDLMVKVPQEMMINLLNTVTVVRGGQNLESGDVSNLSTEKEIIDSASLKNEIKVKKESPLPSRGFMTPGGSSIFLDDLQETMHEYSRTLGEQPLDEMQNMSSNRTKRHLEHISNLPAHKDNKSRKTSDHMAKYLKESLAPGILSLTNALESIAGDKTTFASFENFNLLSDLAYIPNINDSGSSNGSPYNIITSNTTFEEQQHQQHQPGIYGDFFLDIETYQDDLMKIEGAFEVEPKGVLMDPVRKGIALYKASPIVDVSDVEDDDDDDELNIYNQQVRLMHGDYASSSSSRGYSIPRGLIPLPDILLNVPYYLESFHFFRDVTSGTLVPAPAHIYKENPFRVVLPRLAMSNESILSVLIAFGITHKSFMLGQPEPKEVLDQLLSRCFKDLILLLEDKENCKSDLTLALVLMIGSYDMFSSIQNNWKTHFQGAKQIMLKRGLKSPFSKKSLDFASKKFSKIDKLPLTVSDVPKLESRATTVSQFLVGWFNYIDVLSCLATPLKPTKVQSIDMEREKAENSHSATAYYGLEEDVEIDMFLGFDIRFLQIASELTQLIKRVNLFLMTTEQDSEKAVLPREYTLRAVEVRENLSQVFHTSSQKYVGDINDSFSVLKSTNELFYLALLIHLYRRVFLVPSNSNVIKSLCLKILKILRDNIPLGSNLEICSSFVIFTAGLEVKDEDSRIFFINRLTNQFNIGNYICKKLSEVLQLSWKLNKTWIDVVEQYNIDLTFV